jgi:hypothetical protein
MQMTDEQWWLHQARERASNAYRAKGFDEFADRVKQGKEDSCSLMRLARFFIEPSPPPDEQFCTAWDEFASAEASEVR